MDNFSAYSLQQVRVNALTVDVEDYHAIASRWWFDQEIKPSKAVFECTEFILDALAEFQTKATFFVLGEVAEAYPSLVKRIADGGHELGVHGYRHLWVNTLTAEQFQDEVERAKKLVEDITGRCVLGHRAPVFSINLKMTWAFEVLSKLGFEYDSGVLPGKASRRGGSSVAREPFEIELPNTSIWEVPPAALEFMGRCWPICGGGYLRHFPYGVNRWGLKKMNKRRAAVVYMHPYEFSSGRRRAASSSWSVRKKFRYAIFLALQYRNRRTMKSKLRKLLTDFEFGRVIDVYGPVVGHPK